MLAPPSSQLPRISGGAVFRGVGELAGRRHVNVDGPASTGMALGLSHWPNGGTPDELRADTSTAIAVRYLATNPAGPEVGALSNDHYDEDGLLAAWVLLTRPLEAQRSHAVSAAEAGDFFTWTDPAAAMIALAAMAMAEPETTPFPDVHRAFATRRGGDPTGAIYRAILPHVGRLIDDPGRFRLLWSDAWERVLRNREEIDAGTIRIDDVPTCDLAVVHAPRSVERLAAFPRIASMRVLWDLADGTIHLEHRYETWVTFTSRPLPARVDLSAAADRLTERDGNGVTWRFDGIEHPRARLCPVDASGRPARSALDSASVAAIIREAT
jgi:hypothetical protein